MLASGALLPGEQLVVNRRTGQIRGELLADATIVVQGVSYQSPSQAACAALDVGSVDGWNRWRIVRLGGRSLSQLRSEVIG